MNIYCVHIDQILDEDIFKEMIQYVSFEKQTRILRFRKPIDALRSLFGDLIIRSILCRHHGFRNNEIKYEYHEFGKPYLPNHPGFHFNISHSGNWVVGVVSTDAVGIDIEKITEVKADLPSSALTEEENKKLQALNEAERNVLFFELWTLKESYAKATGKGLSEGLNTLKFSVDRGIIQIQKDEKPVRAYFEILECLEGYKFSLCSFSENRNRNIKLFALKEFMEKTKTALNSYHPLY